jgi:hypothetical protein
VGVITTRPDAERLEIEARKRRIAEQFAIKLEIKRMLTEKAPVPIRRQEPMDLTGRKFKDLRAIGPIEGRPKTWRCQCTCGKVVEIEARDLLIGKRARCGKQCPRWAKINRML